MEHVVGDTVLLSVVFSWDLDKALQRAVDLWSLGHKVEIGGPAACYAGLGSLSQPDAYLWHNERAVFTTKGCVRSCSFCVVPATEGGLVELSNWSRAVPDQPIVCDNDFAASSQRHFDKAIDYLKSAKRIDIQGVSVFSLTDYRVQRLAESVRKLVSGQVSRSCCVPVSPKQELWYMC